MIRFPSSVLNEGVVRNAVTGRLSERLGLLPTSIVHRAVATRVEQVADWILARVADGYTPWSESVHAASKSSHGIRPVAEWGVIEQVIYRALADQLAADLGAIEWKHRTYSEFRAAPLGLSSDYILATDITAFYQYVDHGLMVEEVSHRTGRRSEVESATRLLKGVSGRAVGLPQQSHASDVLADPYAAILERKQLRRGVPVWRHNDDFLFALDSWSEVIETIESFDAHARRLGLAVNDAKTRTYLRSTYEQNIEESHRVLQQISTEVEFDLTEWEFDYEDGTVQVSPEESAVYLATCERVLQLRAGLANSSHDWSQAEQRRFQALQRLIPQLLGRVPSIVEDLSDSLLASSLSLLTTEQQLTPSVVRCLAEYIDRDPEMAVAAVAKVLDHGAYLTGWQCLWIASELARVSDLETIPGGGGVVAWAKDLSDSEDATVALRSVATLLLAKNSRVRADHVARLYEISDITSQPVLCAAMGAAQLSGAVVNSMLDESQLNQWCYAVGVQM